VPPFIGVAVKVVDAPLQIVEVPEIETEGVSIEFTVIVTELDVEGLPDTQPAAEVMIQVTTSLFANVVDV